MSIINNDYTKEVGIIDMTNGNIGFLYVEGGILKGEINGGVITIGSTGAGTGDITGIGTNTQLSFFNNVSGKSIGSTGSANGSITYNNTTGLTIDSISNSYGFNLNKGMRLINKTSAEPYYDITTGDIDMSAYNSMLYIYSKSSSESPFGGIHCGNITISNGTYNNNITIKETSDVIQIASKNVILGTTDGVNTRIPYFDSSNSLTNSSNLYYNNSIGKLYVYGATVITGSGTSGRIPYFNDSNSLTTSSSFSYNSGVITCNSLNTTTNLTRNSKNVITNISDQINYPVKVNQIPYYNSTSQTSDTITSDKLSFDGNNLTVGNTSNYNVSIVSGSDEIDSKIIFKNNILSSVHLIVSLDDDDNSFLQNIIIGSPSTSFHPIISQDIGHSTILGNKTICNRSNDMVRAIDSDISNTENDGVSNNRTSNRSINGSITFSATVTTTGDTIFEFNCFNNTIVSFEAQMTMFSNTVSSVAIVVHIRGGFICGSGSLLSLSTDFINIMGLPKTVYIESNTSTDNIFKFVLVNGSTSTNIKVHGVFNYVEYHSNFVPLLP